jgi:DNA-nicking Smr family endonuclease
MYSKKTLLDIYWRSKMPTSYQDKTDTLTDRPFSGLKALVEAARKDTEDNAKKPQKTQKTDELPAVQPDNALFLAAVQDIIPLNKENKDELETAPHKDGPPEQTLSKALPDPLEAEKTEILEALNSMISGESPFPVRQTPEFVEGPGRDTNEWLVTRLHRGEFSVQGYCDLHGLDTTGALDACESFLGQAISEGKRCVALIHGRGLSSPNGPVLKDAVTRWIAYGRYRRFILAYSSAPAWDGGAGVTYVLLRRRPQKRMAS